MPEKFDTYLALLSTTWRTTLGAWHGFKSLCENYPNLSDCQQTLPAHANPLELVGVGKPQERPETSIPGPRHQHTYTLIHSCTCPQTQNVHVFVHTLSYTHTHANAYAHADSVQPQA